MLRVNNLVSLGSGGNGPMVTSSAAIPAVDGEVLAHVVVTDQPCTLTIGGADAAEVELASNTLATTHTLRWASNGTRGPTSPSDADTDNVYEVELTPTDAYGRDGLTQEAEITVDYDWQTTFSVTLNTSSFNWNGFTIRQIIPGSLINIDGTTVVRLRLTAGTAAGFSIDALYIGEKASSGDDYDMKASTPAPARFQQDGSNTIVAALGETIHTDALSFVIDQSKDYIVSAHFNATSSIMTRTNFHVDLDCYNRSGVSEAGTADVSSYNLMSNNSILMVDRLEVA